MKHLRFLSGSLLLALLSVPSFAADRNLTITAPTKASAGSTISAIVTASTDGTEGEVVWFFHAEYSVDRGKTWNGISYDQDLGAAVSRTAQIKVSSDSSMILVRARACFRGSEAGDVDFNGDPIEWEKSWAKWWSPPSKIVKVVVE
jgi:hypothetical protein